MTTPRTLSLIVAVDLNGVIGKEGRMPWPRLKRDMQWFRQHTLGKTIVMGRKTHHSIGSTLAHRHNIVLTRSGKVCCKGASIAHNLEDVLKYFHPPGEELVVIGGSEIYALYLPQVTRIYRTLIHAEFEGDKFFRTPNLDSNWTRTSHETAEEKGLKMGFDIYERFQEDIG